MRAAIGISLYDLRGMRIPRILERIGIQKDALVTVFFVGTPFIMTFWVYVLLKRGSKPVPEKA